VRLPVTLPAVQTGKRIALSLGVLALLTPRLADAQPSSQSVPLPRAARARIVLDSLATDFALHGTVPGTAIAVVRGRDTLLFKAYGKANLELGIPMTVNSVFRIGSVTKQFASSAVMQLAQQGKLAVTDTIGQWVPNLPVTWRSVTIAQLLNHTSGIPSYTELGETWMKRWGEEMTGAELVALTADKPFDFPAGTSWKYNNTGYVLLGMLIEARTGHTWGDDFAERFFKPFGMRATRYCENGALIQNRASGYSRNEKDEWLNARYLAMSQPHAAGALCSTIGDVLAWNRALHGGAVVTAASYTAMTTPSGAAAAQHYGSGLSIETLASHRVIAHNGGINGFLTGNLYVPDAQLSVTVLTNGEFANPDRITHQLALAALGIPLDIPPTGITLSPAVRASYVAKYDLVLDAPHLFTVYEKDGALFGTMDGQSAGKMIPLGNDTFGVAFNDEVRVIFTMAAGRPTKMTLRQNGKDFEGLVHP
jgi:D-alanyl-D-alanine carboxypeptidase